MDGVYHGSVSENGGLVEVSPEIKAKNGPICGYRIVNSHKGKIPFEVGEEQKTVIGEIQPQSRHSERLANE